MEHRDLYNVFLILKALRQYGSERKLNNFVFFKFKQLYEKIYQPHFYDIEVYILYNFTTDILMHYKM